MCVLFSLCKCWREDEQDDELWSCDVHDAVCGDGSDNVKPSSCTMSVLCYRGYNGASRDRSVITLKLKEKSPSAASILMTASFHLSRWIVIETRLNFTCDTQSDPANVIRQHYLAFVFIICKYTIVLLKSWF